MSGIYLLQLASIYWASYSQWPWLNHTDLQSQPSVVNYLQLQLQHRHLADAELMQSDLQVQN